MRVVTSVFITTLILFSIFSYAYVDVNLSYLSGLYTGYYFAHRILLASIYTILIAVLFGCFYFFTKNADRLKRNLKKTIILAIIATVIAYPAVLAFDIFNYIATARVLFLFQENPYIIYPIEFINDPHIDFTRAANKTALYGPFWILLTGIPYFLGLGNFLFTMFSFKLLIAGFFVGTIILLNKLDKRAVLFFALNPLVIIETLGSAHNDIVMMFFALLPFYLLRSHKVLSLVSFIGSFMIKFATIFLLPVYLMSFARKIKEKYKYSAIFMFIVFLLSPLREELYPWYAIWFIVFTAFLYKNRFLQNLVLVFSFGLLLRYIPYMATGNYFGPTPIFRNLLMVAPVVIFLIYSWLRMLFQRS